MATEWRGAGWYTVVAWKNKRNSWMWKWVEAPEAHYLECKDEFEEFAQVPERCEAVVEYYGDGLLPDEPVPLCEWLDELLHQYDDLTGQHGWELYHRAVDEPGAPWYDEEEAEELGIQPGEFDYDKWRKEYERRYWEAVDALAGEVAGALLDRGCNV